MVTLSTSRFTAWLSLLAATLVGCSGGRGQGGEPAGPHAAAAAFFTAIERLDTTALRSAFASDADPALVDALATQLDASRRLRAAAIRKLGRDSARVADGDWSAASAWRKSLRQASVEPDDQGVVLRPEQGPPMRLRQENRLWKVVAYPADAAPQEVDRAVRLLNELTKALDEATARIMADELKDVRSVRMAVGRRAVDALVSFQ
jgi:hypothetical protein